MNIINITNIAMEESKLWDTNEFAGMQIRMRKSDGYFNAKDMCRVENKLVKDYLRLDQTKKFIEALKKEVGEISPLPILEVITLGMNENRGTWIHPKLAIHLAMWISPEFSVKVIDWVERYLRGDLSLVADVVTRHDELNDMKSEVLIRSVDNKISAEIIENYRQQIELMRESFQQLELTANSLRTSNLELKESNQRLENTTNTLRTSLANLNRLNCRYCNKRYSSTAGLTRHFKKCPDKAMSEHRFLLEFNKFKVYIELLIAHNIFTDIQLLQLDWNTEWPRVKVIRGNSELTYRIYLNESRWKLVKQFFAERVHIPILDLLGRSSSRIFEQNRDICNIIQTHIERPGEIPLEFELRAQLNPDDDD